MQKALKDKRITPSPRGKIDPAIADLQWETRTAPRTPPPDAHDDDEPEASSDSGAGGSYLDARARHEEYKAKKAALEYGVLAGELVPALGVKKEAARLSRLTREKVLAVATRVSAIAAAETDAPTIERLLLKELRAALLGLGDE